MIRPVFSLSKLTIDENKTIGNSRWGDFTGLKRDERCLSFGWWCRCWWQCFIWNCGNALKVKASSILKQVIIKFV
jgi:hypothetical protein